MSAALTTSALGEWKQTISVAGSMVCISPRPIFKSFLAFVSQ